MIRRALGLLGKALFFALVLSLLAVQIVPPFLDRIYYEGAAGDHFDGERFFNPDGEESAIPLGKGRGGRSKFLLRQMVGADDRPAWPTKVAVTPAKPAARVDGDKMVATWVGHATVLVQTGGLNILTDPVWADRAGPLGFGPLRTAAPGIAFDDLPSIDLVLVSHNHYDHMDLATLRRLYDRDHPLIVTSPGNDRLLRDAGVADVTVLDWGGRYDRPSASGKDCGAGRGGCPVDFSVAVTRNHHWGSRWFTDRNRALWSSFVVILPGGNIFFAGDTGPGDMKWPGEARRLGPVRLAILPIGAFRFRPGQMVTGSHIGPIEAAEVFARLGAPTGLPIHWGTFRLSDEARDTPPRLLEAVMKCRRDIDGRFSPVPIGQSVSVPALSVPALPVPGATPATPHVSRQSVVACLDTPEVRALR